MLILSVQNIEQELSTDGFWKYLGKGRYIDHKSCIIATYDQIADVPRRLGLRRDTRSGRTRSENELLFPYGFRSLRGSRGPKLWASRIRYEKMVLQSDDTKIFYANLDLMNTHAARNCWIHMVFEPLPY